nr:RDD family protein [Brevibacillus migulae]
MGNYAGFWIRVGAYLIDAVLIYVLTLILTLVHESLVWIAYIASILYFPLMESSSYQGSLGKKWLGLRVVDEQGERIGLGRAFGRFFSKILSGIILYIGYIMVAFTENKQGLHDKIVGTYVVKG